MMAHKNPQDVPLPILSITVLINGHLITIPVPGSGQTQRDDTAAPGQPHAAAQ